MLVLIAGLVVLLILVVLFREEIREAISVGVLLFAGYAFWVYDAWWAKVVGGALYVTAALGVVGMIAGARERGARSRVEAQQQAGVHPPAAPPPPHVVWEDGWWFRGPHGVERGPVSEDRLLAMLRERRLPPDTLIRWGRQGEWHAANRLWAARF